MNRNHPNYVVLKKLATETPYALDTIIAVNDILAGVELTFEIVHLASRCAMDPVTLAEHVVKIGIENVRRRYNMPWQCGGGHE